MSETLFVEAYALLDTSETPEEDTIEQIEALVHKIFPDLSSSNVERLVLDVLMAHHYKKDPLEASRAQVITTTVAKPVSKFPKTNDSPKQTSVVENKRPFDQMRELLGEENSDEDINRVLSHNDFHLQRTIDLLSGEPVNLELTKEQMAARIMCRYYLSGNCIRGAQCMYSHDGGSRICRFWLHEKCLAGKNCIFMHSVPIPTEEVPVTQTKLQLNSLPTLGQKAPKPAKTTANLTKTVKVKPKLAPIKSVLGTDSNSIPIVGPRLVPWKKRSFGNNQKYVDLRLMAAQKADVRNKLLLESTTAWTLNDAAKAKLLSAKGREAETEMVKLYRKAADLLWEQQSMVNSELWLDLHGLELAEAINLLESRLELVAATQQHNPRVMYVITGRGHFKAKKYADQLSQYVSALLNSQGCKHRDFGVDPTFGRITGIDPFSLHKRVS